MVLLNFNNSKSWVLLYCKKNWYIFFVWKRWRKGVYGINLDGYISLREPKAIVFQILTDRKVHTL